MAYSFQIFVNAVMILLCHTRSESRLPDTRECHDIGVQYFIRFETSLPDVYESCYDLALLCEGMLWDAISNNDLSRKSAMRLKFL